MKLLTITTLVPTLLAMMMSIGIDGVHSYDYDSSSGGRLRGAVESGGYDDEVGDWDWDNKDDVGDLELESDNFLEVGSLRTCTFPFPNCPNGFNCINRLNARPVCHRRGDCYPRGYRAPRTGRFQFAICCSNRGSGNHCL